MSLTKYVNLGLICAQEVGKNVTSLATFLILTPRVNGHRFFGRGDAKKMQTFHSPAASFLRWGGSSDDLWGYGVRCRTCGIRPFATADSADIRDASPLKSKLIHLSNLV